MTCAACGRGFALSAKTRDERRSNVCQSCQREDNFDPGKRERAWVEAIPDERLDGLLVAVRSLR
jgi:hypothetical protein